MEWQFLMTLPNILTLARLILSPIFIPFLLAYLLPLNIFWINIFLAIVFLFFGLTDFFDGYYARKWDQVSHLGSLLDPIADKFLFCSALISLVAAQKIFFYWVIILLSREFFVMGLRIIASEKGLYVRSSIIAKVKTVIEVIFIAIVILNPSTKNHSLFNTWNLVEFLFLNITIVLSIYSAYQYYIFFMNQLNHKIGIHE